MRKPCPLQWPDGWQRTASDERRPSRFGGHAGVGFSVALTDLRLELTRLGAANPVITTDLPVRLDGLPYSAAGPIKDPAVAVWFVLDGHERVFACDRWRTHAENMRAIAKTIEAMRGLARWGAADVVHRAFSGFAALPPGEPAHDRTPRHRPWRDVLGGPWPAELAGLDLFVLAKARHRAAIQGAHPDVGGSTEVAAELNAALAEAERELGIAVGVAQ